MEIEVAFSDSQLRCTLPGCARDWGLTVKDFAVAEAGGAGVFGVGLVHAPTVASSATTPAEIAALGLRAMFRLDILIISLVGPG
jgi:hypothetical protein